MMEFTLSRVVMSLCGLLVMAAVMGPFMGMLDQRTEEAGIESADAIVELFQKLSERGEGTNYYIRCSDILPSPQWHLVLDGGRLVLSMEGREFVSYSQVKLTDECIVLGYDDCLAVSVVMQDGLPSLQLQKVLETFSNASTSLCMSSSSL
ncbi:MAG: hypothetical protein PHW93_00170 [Candidatus Methanomethylophilaceae archaeon]|nr:hypothetical protein [Candidatus Methanomethylophilaceae archaeon]